MTIQFGTEISKNYYFLILISDIFVMTIKSRVRNTIGIERVDNTLCTNRNTRNHFNILCTK